MKKYLYLLSIICLLTSCWEKNKESSQINPIIPDNHVIDVAKSNFLLTDEEKIEVESSLNNGTILEDFNGRDAYKIVLYSILKQDESKYNLSVAHSEFGAKFLGMPYTIKMKMTTYITPNSSFTEGIADGRIVIKKALRNYDNFANSNTVYKGKKTFRI